MAERRKLSGLRAEYERGELQERAELERKLASLKKELEKTRGKVAELVEEAGRCGLSLEEALDDLKKISDLGREAKELSAKVERKKRELGRVEEKIQRDWAHLFRDARELTEDYEEAKALNKGLHGIFDRPKKTLKNDPRRGRGRDWRATRSWR